MPIGAVSEGSGVTSLFRRGWRVVGTGMEGASELGVLRMGWVMRAAPTAPPCHTPSPPPCSPHPRCLSPHPCSPSMPQIPLDRASSPCPQILPPGIRAGTLSHTRCWGAGAQGCAQGGSPCWPPSPRSRCPSPVTQCAAPAGAPGRAGSAPGTPRTPQQGLGVLRDGHPPCGAGAGWQR